MANRWRQELGGGGQQKNGKEKGFTSQWMSLYSWRAMAVGSGARASVTCDRRRAGPAATVARTERARVSCPGVADEWGSVGF
jgi:hypothetical protein